jgi:type IV pilus assembly protein PilM
MLRLSSAIIHPIGLDIGDDAVRLLQVETSGRSLSVVAAAKQPLDTGFSSATERFRVACHHALRMIRQGGFKGRSVVAALPFDIVQVKNLRLPQMPAAELDAAVRFEASNVLPFVAEEATIDYLAAGEVRQGSDVRQEVIVVGAARQDVDMLVEQMHAARLAVQGLDFGPVALYRTVERFIRRKEDEQDVQVLLEVGTKRTQVIVGRGREMCFYKAIDIGGDQFTECLVRKLGITAEEARGLRHRAAGLVNETSASSDGSGSGAHGEPAPRDSVAKAVADATRSAMEELAREVALCLRYCAVTFRGQRPGKVRLIGTEAADIHLRAVTQAVLGVPVEIGRPLFNANADSMSAVERRGPMSDWATALGLALRDARGPFAPRDGKPRPMWTGDAAVEVVDLPGSKPARSEPVPPPADGTAPDATDAYRAAVEAVHA